jgi:hypothetical protein
MRRRRGRGRKNKRVGRTTKKNKGTTPVAKKQQLSNKKYTGAKLAK